MRKKFIVIDGGEGSGKTTMINSLSEILEKDSFIITHEPGGTPFADKIRELFLSPEGKNSNAETNFGLVWASRAEHLDKKIRPALAENKIIICDRFDSSTFAYQIYAQKMKKLKELFWQTREIFLGKTKPDIYIFFDVKPEIGLERVAKRKEIKTHFDERKLDFHKTVRKGFKEFFKNVPHIVIDASQPIDKVKEDFHKEILKIIT